MASSPDGAAAEPRDAELAAVVIRFLGAVIALVVAAAVVAVATRVEDDAGGEGAAGVAAERGGEPARGTAVASYVDRRAGALDALGSGGPQAAVVSFGRYVTADAAGDLLADVSVRALLVAAPGGAPGPVGPGGVEAWAAAEREGALAEIAELERLIPTTQDAAFVEQYRADIERLRVLAAADAAGPVVFGAVVVGPAPTLRALARRPEVRLVDPAGSPSPPALDRVSGLRPEETVTVGDPPERPAR
ncbi:MAG TPA: hypothetical protein VF230_13530 [Acidimicrobiales bacterium]